MPGRLIPIVTDQIYNVFNRGIDRRPTFIGKLELNRAIDILDFYRFANLPTCLSKYLKLPNEERENIFKELKEKNKKLIEIYSYCLMPNHFHFLMKQLQDNGISKFMSNFQNSYTRYFNVKKKRDGPLFLDQFKAVRIETDEQFLHVSRYIHLNPLTSYVIKDFKDLIEYPWSSLSEYQNNNLLICETSTILDFLGKRKQQKKYLDFIRDQVNYQREFHKIGHLILE